MTMKKKEMMRQGYHVVHQKTFLLHQLHQNMPHSEEKRMGKSERAKANEKDEKRKGK